MVKSCYIHIPFCKSICSYCDFCKNYYNELIVSQYLNNLEKEIKINYKGEVLNTLYIGGGTPSGLSYNDLNKLFNIFKIFKLNNNYENTFECNYEDINEDLLVILKNNGVNRISIGIQTFNEKFSKVLNRKIDKKEMLKKINLTKKFFSNINIDLMYAIPGEGIRELKKDLEIIKMLNVTHISTYALILEKHTNIKLTNEKEVSDSTQNQMYYTIVNFLKKLGYKHYEISNFSKEGYESKHNLAYWNNINYYGFGAGASGFLGKKRYDNTKSIFNYNKGITKIYEEYMKKSKLIKDEIMLGLRKIEGINVLNFEKKYHLRINEIFDVSYLINNKFLIFKNNYLFIPEKYLFVSNEIILKLLDTYILN